LTPQGSFEIAIVEKELLRPLWKYGTMRSELVATRASVTNRCKRLLQGVEICDHYVPGLEN
jgi:hypothetical protein